MNAAREIAYSESWLRVLLFCFAAVAVGHVIWAIAKYGMKHAVHFLCAFQPFNGKYYLV